MGFSNKTATKQVVGTLIEQCYEIAGHSETVKVLDELKTLVMSMPQVQECQLASVI